jgi:glycosyltransferase involved in cell wall biosynthesis
LYSGNLGRLHDISTLIDFHRILEGKIPPADFIFHATGDGFLRLRDSIADNHFQFLGLLNNDKWIETMRDSHVALVTMKPGAEKVVMPSKTYSAMLAGQAILAICPGNSDLADLVKKHDCGWHIPVGDHQALTKILADIQNNPECLHRKRINAYHSGHRLYDMKNISDIWMELFKSL